VGTGAVQIGEDLAAAADEVGSRFSEVDFLFDTTELSAIADRLAECAGLF
jgi:hypothetical protein